VSTFDRRGACPGLSAPMPTGDGLLVRLMPTDSVAVTDLLALCAAARRDGNGTIEITARGSLQVRGLSASSAHAFARAVAELGIAASDGLGVLTNPLPGDPEAIIDPGPVAAAVRRAAAQASLELSAKVSVIIDAGGRLHLDALPADIRLRAIRFAEKPLLHVSIGGDAASARPLGAIALPAANDVALALLGAIAAQGPHARAAELVAAVDIEHLRSLIGDHLQCAPTAPRRLPAEMIGTHRLQDGSMAVGVALPFGHIHSDALAALTRLAGTYGVRSVRLAPGRALLLLGVAAENAAALGREAARLGLIVDADDPRRRIVACPGKPACASGLIASRALATELAQSLVLARGLSGAANSAIPPPERGRSATRDLIGGRRVGINPRPRSSPNASAERGTPTRQHLLRSEANAVDLPLTGGGMEAPPSAAQLIHISGCAKGCAHPGTAALTVVGTERGCGIVHAGSARAVPSSHVDPAHIVAEIEHMFSKTKAAADA
jgi:precorrin-3B synthase